MDPNLITWMRNKLKRHDSDLAEMANKVFELATMTDVDVNEAISSKVQSELSITTYTNGTNEIVHPSILFFPDKWKGYKYWLGYNCYDNADSQFENPCIAVSNDNITWTTPEGLTNPIEPKPSSGYYADINLFMSKDNKTMNMVFKYAGTTKITYLRTSTDGVNWTPKVKLFENSFEDVSPSVIWDGTQYVMWTVKHADTPNGLYRRTAPVATGPWSEPVLCTVSLPSGIEMWHMDIRKLGNQYHILMFTTSSSDYPLWFGKSEDGLSWDFGKYALLYRGTDGTTNYSLYKATMFPMITPEGLKYALWYGTQAPYKICYSEITFDRTRLKQEGNNNVLQASLPLSPWVFCDTFNRADSDSTLGNATTGQAWVNLSGNTFGTISNQAYLPVAANSKSVIDIGIADFYTEVKIVAAPSTGYLMFRVIDSSNYWRIGIESGSRFIIQKIVSGTAALTNKIEKFIAGDRLGVECSGDVINIFINGKKIYTLTDSTFNTGTKIGFNCDNTTVRFDNLIARALY